MDAISQLVSQVKEFVTICTLYPPWIRKAAPLAFTAINRMAPNLMVKGAPLSLLRVAEILYMSYHTTLEFAMMIFADVPQRSPPWIRIRSGWVDLDQKVVRAPVVSSSVVGQILQHKYGYIKDECACLSEQVYPENKKPVDAFGVTAMARGTAAEPMIMRKTRLVLLRNVSISRPKAELQIEEVGLQIARHLPYMGVSIDGKIKFYDPDTQTWYIGGDEMKNRAEIDQDPYPEIKVEYHDQIQHTMALQDWKEYVFVCYSARLFSFENYKFDEPGWERHLDQIDVYYWKRLWPCILLKGLGLISYPNLLPHFTVMSSPIFEHPLMQESGNLTTFIDVLDYVLGTHDAEPPPAKRAKH